MNSKQELWQEYFKAIKAGRSSDAKEILSKIHRTAPSRRGPGTGGCSRCKKRFN